MSQRTADLLGKELVSHGLSKKADKEFEDYHDSFRDMCLAANMDFGSTKEMKTNFWRCLQETYDTLFPTNIDFFNHCFNEFEDETIFAYPYFKRHVIDKLPSGKWTINNYIKNKGFRYAKKYNLPSKMSFDEIGKVLWNEYSHSISIGNEFWFAQVENKGDKWKCDSGLPFYMFRRSGFNSYLVNVE